jgi:hypothetical protein
MIRRRTIATVAVLVVGSIFVLVVAANGYGRSTAGPAFRHKLLRREVVKTCEEIHHRYYLDLRQSDLDHCDHCCRVAGLVGDQSNHLNKCHCVRPSLVRLINGWIKVRAEAARKQEEDEEKGGERELPTAAKRLN